MTYMIVDRPDGWVEVVVMRATLVGVFPERETASRVCAFLNVEEPELPDVASASFSVAAADVAEMVEEIGADGATAGTALRAVPATPPRPAPKTPVEPSAPMAPVFQRVDVATLTSEQRDTAFRRIGAGEKLGEVAPDFGLTMTQLRGMWANHKRTLQKFYAEGGKETCRGCGREFTPSVSSPDTCARCSREA